MTDNPGEMHIRYDVDQSSIDRAIAAVNSLQQAIDNDTISMAGWNAEAIKAVRIIDEQVPAANADAESIKLISNAFLSWRINLSELPAELTDVANSMAILQAGMTQVVVTTEKFAGENVLNALKQNILEFDDETAAVQRNVAAKKIARDIDAELEASIEAQFASPPVGDFSGASDYPKPLHPQGIAIPNADDIPEDLARKYDLKRPAEFNPPPQGLQGANDVLWKASEITGANEALRDVREQLQLTYASLARMKGGLSDLSPEFKNLATEIINFGSTDQNLKNTADAIDRILTQTGELGGGGTASLRQAALAVDDFSEKFRLPQIKGKRDEEGDYVGLSTTNLPEFQAELPIGGATIPGAPEGLEASDFTNRVSQNYLDAQKAVKQFNAALIENKDTFDAQDPELRDIAGIFAMLNEKIKDGTATMVDMIDATDRLNNADRDLADAPDFYQKLIGSMDVFVQKQQQIADMVVPQGGAGGAGGPLPPTPEYVPFAGAKQLGDTGLVDEANLGPVKADIAQVKESWLDISKVEYDAVQQLDGVSTKMDEINGKYFVLVGSSKEYNAALEVMDAALDAAKPPPSSDELQKREVFGGIVDVQHQAAMDESVSLAPLSSNIDDVRERWKGLIDEQKISGDEAGNWVASINEVKGPLADMDQVMRDIADYQSRAAEEAAKMAEEVAANNLEGKPERDARAAEIDSLNKKQDEEFDPNAWNVTQDIPDISDQLKAKEAAADISKVDDEIKKVASDAKDIPPVNVGRGGGAGGPPKPPPPDYTIPPEYGGAPNVPTPKSLKFDIGFGDTQVEARKAEEAVNEVLKSIRDLSETKRGLNEDDAHYNQTLLKTNDIYASLTTRARELHVAAEIQTITDQFVTLTANEGNADRNLQALINTLHTIPGVASKDIAAAVEQFDLMVEKEQQLISIQDQLNTKPLNLTVAGSQDRLTDTGQPESAKSIENTFSILTSTDKDAQSAAQVQSELAAIMQDLSVINPLADKTSFAFQNIAAASQEVRQIAAIDNLVQKFGELYDPISQGNEALGVMTNYLQSVGAAPEQIEQAAQAFKDLQANALQAAGAEEQNAKILRDIADAKKYLNDQSLLPPEYQDANQGEPSSGLGQKAVPAEGLRRTGTALSQLGMGNKDLQQIGTDIRLIGDVQQVNKEIGLLSNAFKDLPGNMGEAAKAASSMATSIAGPVAGSFASLMTVAGPFAALISVGAIAWHQLNEELKQANADLTAANSAVKDYFNAIAEGTTSSIADQIQKAQDQEDIINNTLNTQSNAMAHGIQSSFDQWGPIVGQAFVDLGQSGLIGGDAMKNMQGEMDKARQKSLDLAFSVTELKNAQVSASVAANSVAENIVKVANDLIAVRKQEASDTTMTSDAIKKRAEDLRSERGILEEAKAADEEALNVKGITSTETRKLNADLAKTNDLLDKNALEQKFITDTAEPLIAAREKEAAAMKAEQEEISKVTNALIADAQAKGKDVTDVEKAKRGDSAATVKNTIQDFQDQMDGIQATIQKLKHATIGTGRDDPGGKEIYGELDKEQKLYDDLKAKMEEYQNSVLPTVQAHERLADITKELTSETDLYIKKEEDVTKIRQDDATKRVEIEQSYSDKLIAIAQKARDTAASALLELNRKQSDDLKKLGDAQGDDSIKLAIQKRDAAIKFGEQEVKDYQDHVNKLKELRDKTSQSEYDDIANRDFAALARDMRKANQEKEAENTSYSQKEAQKQTQFADEIKLDNLHAKDQAKERLTQYERENRDAQIQYQRKLEDADTAAQKERDAAAAAKVREINAEVNHLTQMLNMREQGYANDLTALRKHLQDELDIVNGTKVNTQGGAGYSYGPQNQGYTQPNANPNPTMQVYGPAQYGGGGQVQQAPTLNTTVTGNTIATPNLQDLISGVENAGISLLQNFFNS